MISALYLLSACIAGFVCLLLARAYRATRVRLLFFSALCFAGIALNNALVLFDAQAPGTDLSLWRSLPALAGVLFMLYGLVFETR